MDLFFEFFYELCMQILMNIAEFFRTVFSAFYNAGLSFVMYFNTITHYFAEFDTAGKILCIVSVLVLAGLFALIFFFILKFLKKYIRFRRKIINEEEMLKEISRLNREVAILADEKNRLMAMKVGNASSPNCGIERTSVASMTPRAVTENR